MENAEYMRQLNNTSQSQILKSTRTSVRFIPLVWHQVSYPCQTTGNYTFLFIDIYNFTYPSYGKLKGFWIE